MWSEKDAESLAYIVTYVFPFLDVDFSNAIKALSLVILFGTLAVIYINANMLHLNPVLNLIGWHIYEVGMTDGPSKTVISRRKRLPRGTKLRCVSITHEILWEVKA